MAKLTKNAVAEQIHELDGNISAVARAFGKSRKWLYEYCKEKYPELWEEVIQAREAMKDDAESQLYKNIKAGKETSLIFYLKTQAKDRGYVERQELAGVKDAPIVIVNWDDQEDN